jgi:hypothetical protein
MKKLLLLASVFALADLHAAHAQTSPPPADSTVARPRPARPQRDRISHDEVAGSQALTAFDLVQSLRPMWFNRTRQGMTAGSTGTPMDERSEPLIVIMGTAVLGGKEALRDVPIGQVYSLEFLSPSQAHMRYDRMPRDGAIVIHQTAASDPATRPRG